MAKKLFSQPKLAKTEERILQEMVFTRQSITNSITSEKTALTHKNAKISNIMIPKEHDRMLVSDLYLTIKYLDKGI